MKRLSIILIGALVLLVAYNLTGDSEDSATAQTGAEEGAQAQDGSIFSAQIQAIEKAKGVEAGIMSAFEKRDAQMDAQGQ